MPSEIIIQDMWYIFVRDIHMSDQIVQLVTLSGKWIAMTQECSIDLVNCLMLPLNCTWSKVMVLCDLASFNIKLNLKLA